MTRPCPDVSELFWLNDPADYSAFAGIITAGGPDREVFHAGVRPRAGLTLYALGLLVPQTAVEIGKTTGTRPPDDVIWAELSCVITRSSLLEALRPFTGWASYPVRVTASDESYSGLAVWGRSGVTSMDPRIETIDGHDHYVGMRFDPASWDGSDLFISSRGRGPIVTKPVRDALLAAGMTNARFTPLSDVRSRVDVYQEMRSGWANPDSDPAFHDPIRPYMFRLQSTHPLETGSNQILGVAGNAQRAYIGPGNRVVMVDHTHEVDAVVTALAPAGEVVAAPIIQGYGSLRLRQ